LKIFGRLRQRKHPQFRRTCRVTSGARSKGPAAKQFINDLRTADILNEVENRFYLKSRKSNPNQIEKGKKTK